jgi:hypothetical protein
MSLEARISALEQIIIIIITGGGHFPGVPPKGDSFASDTTRLDALAGLRGWIPKGDPFAADISRLSLVAAESALLQVSAELTRLRGVEVELTARLDELRAGSA